MKNFNAVNLTKLKRCDQLWENMSLNEKERICQKCNNMIIDFRKSTPHEIVLSHIQSDRKVCGLHFENQLVTSNPSFRKRAHLKSFHALLFGLLSLNLINAQSEKLTHKTEQNDDLQTIESNSEIVSDSIKPSCQKIMISGRVTDTLGIELPFCNIWINNDMNSMINSDFEGYYSIDISNYLDSSEFVFIRFNFIGYIEHSIRISSSNLNKVNRTIMNIELEEGHFHTTAFYVETRPQRIKRKLNHPALKVQGFNLSRTKSPSLNHSSMKLLSSSSSLL